MADRRGQRRTRIVGGVALVLIAVAAQFLRYVLLPDHDVVQGVTVGVSVLVGLIGVNLTSRALREGAAE